MRRAGLSCSDKDAKVLNVEADFGGPCTCYDSRGRSGREGGFTVSSIVCTWVGSIGGRGLVGGTSRGGT